jgi:hypothetical protein
MTYHYRTLMTETIWAGSVRDGAGPDCPAEERKAPQGPMRWELTATSSIQIVPLKPWDTVS